MCDCNVPCFHTPPIQKYRKLTLLLLDCWQREYDQRPYRNFVCESLDFERRMQRPFDSIEDTVTMVEFLKTRSLYSVKLVGLRLPPHATELLQNVVESLSQVINIELRLMDLPKEFFALLQKHVDKMKVKELVLQGTPLDDEDILCLRSFLIQSKTLQYMDVASCGLNQYNFASLADGIHKSKTMIGLNASRLLGHHLPLDSEKISLMLSSLLWQNKLQTIEMEKCEFVAQDMEPIAEYLSHKYSNLLKLNLAYNMLGADGAGYILKAVALSGTLKYLNLSGCGLGTHGGEQVAMYMSSCTHLESLIIQYNAIGSEAINMILLTMKKPLKLKQLFLWGNKYNLKTGNILRRLIEARVVQQETLDITSTYDDTLSGFRVIPWRT